MHATLRWYGGNTELADQLAARADELKGVMGAVDDLRACYLIRTDAGTVSVTITDDEAGGIASSEVRGDVDPGQHAGGRARAAADLDGHDRRQHLTPAREPKPQTEALTRRACQP